MAYSEYILKVNLVIMAGWLLYRLAFRRLTFFQWNRFYLLGSVVLSFILPLLRLPRGSLMAAVDLGGFEWEYVDQLIQSPAPFVPESAGISSHFLFFGIYLVGIIVMLVLFVWKFLKIRRQTRHAIMLNDDGLKVFVHEEKNGSFTLFRRVYLDRFTWDNKQSYVYRHEMVHASQFHFFDLIFMSFVGVLLWFNPFVFLLLRSVRENHEYLADDQSCKEPGALAGYLACLRDETIRRYSPAIESYFKSSTIKKRIIMLTNHHSKSHKRWLYLSTLPVVALILLAFQAPVDHSAVAAVKINAVSGISETIGGEIPSLFPLPEKYREKVTWEYNKTAINPISKKEVTHQGVDIAAPTGTSVFAASEGVVKKAELLGGWGNLLVIEHSEGYSTFYAHLETFSVKVGEQVKRGQEVATVGSTGQSTGSHLHFEVRKEGTHMNPVDYY